MVRIIVLLGSMFVGIAIMLAVLPDLVDLNETTRTASASDAGSTCTTGVGETSCSFNLSTPHEYSDTTQMTVNETSPSSVDRTSTTTVAANRQTLTVSGLGSSTVFLFNVDYKDRAVNVSSGLNDFMRQIPVLVIIGFFAVVVIAAVVVIGGRPGGAFS